MTLPWMTICIAILIAAPEAGVAQDHIQIDDSLAHHADELPVKKGAQWAGKLPKWRFGEYAVVLSKMGWTKSSSSFPIFPLTNRHTTTNKFSFVLADKSGDSAEVRAQRERREESGWTGEQRGGWSVRVAEPDWATDRFGALIMVKRGISQTWTLIWQWSGSLGDAGSFEAFLTDGDRRIDLVPVSEVPSRRLRWRKLARGYQFIEGERALGAVQYEGGEFGNAAIVWLRRDLDPAMRMVLAAAMTTLLQLSNPEVAPN